MEAPLIGICRHRLSIDGVGVTTLVAFHGCPLRCKYCLNPQCLSEDGVWRTLSPQDVMAQLQKDDLYFRATGGGVCFGGGEPLLRSAFIRELLALMPPEWGVTFETSLNVPLHHLESLHSPDPLSSPPLGGSPEAQKPSLMGGGLKGAFIIDIKDMNPQIYRAYTGMDNARVKDNLRWLVSHADIEKVLIRLPLIPDYNTPADVAASRHELEDMGFAHFEEFTYSNIK